MFDPRRVRKSRRCCARVPFTPLPQWCSKSKRTCFVCWKGLSVRFSTQQHLHIIDGIQDKYVRDIGLTVNDAFLVHNLPPLCLRKDIGSLGFLYHTIVLGLAHPEFRILFPATSPPANAHATRLAQSLHSRQLLDRCDGSHSQ